MSIIRVSYLNHFSDLFLSIFKWVGMGCAIGNLGNTGQNIDWVSRVYAVKYQKYNPRNNYIFIYLFFSK